MLSDVFGILGKEIFAGYLECDCSEAVENRNNELEQRRSLEERQEQQRKRKNLQKCGVSLRTIELAKIPDCELAKKMLKGGVYLHGAIGTGKTTAAELALIDLYDHQCKNFKILSAPQLISIIRQGYKAGYDTEEFIKKFASYDVLVIDDIGKETPTEDALMLLYRVIDERYKNMKPTSCTSNYKRSELAKRLSQNGNYETALAIVSRLSESEPIEFKGGDRRLENNTSSYLA